MCNGQPFPTIAPIAGKWARHASHGRITPTGNQNKTMTLDAVEFVKAISSPRAALPALFVSGTSAFWPIVNARKSWRCAAACCLPGKPPPSPTQRTGAAGASPLPDLQGRPVALYRETHGRGTCLLVGAHDRRHFMTDMSTLSAKPWPTSLPLVKETTDPCPKPSFWRRRKHWLRLATTADGHPPRWHGDHFHPEVSPRHALFCDASQTQCHSIPIAHTPAQFNAFYR